MRAGWSHTSHCLRHASVDNLRSGHYSVGQHSKLKRRMHSLRCWSTSLGHRSNQWGIQRHVGRWAPLDRATSQRSRFSSRSHARFVRAPFIKIVSWFVISQTPIEIDKQPPQQKRHHRATSAQVLHKDGTKPFHTTSSFWLFQDLRCHTLSSYLHNVDTGIHHAQPQPGPCVHHHPRLHALYGDSHARGSTRPRIREWQLGYQPPSTSSSLNYSKSSCTTQKFCESPSRHTNKTSITSPMSDHTWKQAWSPKRRIIGLRVTTKSPLGLSESIPIFRQGNTETLSHLRRTLGLSRRIFLKDVLYLQFSRWNFSTTVFT